MAILSFVFLFLFWPLSIVFGHIALHQIRRAQESGRGFALAGLIIGYIILALMVLIVVVVIASTHSSTTNNP
jgi:peptidyl-prolyl cis-trans isomerase B (cyclophilin B)